MSSLSSQEGIEKIANQSAIELLPIGRDEDDGKLAKEPDVGSYHSDGSLSSLGLGDDTDAGAREAGARGRRKPRIQLIQV